MSELDGLVQRCKQGDLAAFSRLFRDHEARLYRLAMTILHNEGDAEDALQDTYIRVFQRINRFQGKSTFETWMTAIMVNVCRDQAGDTDVVSDLAARSQYQVLWCLVGKPGGKHRLSVTPHYHSGSTSYTRPLPVLCQNTCAGWALRIHSWPMRQLSAVSRGSCLSKLR